MPAQFDLVTFNTAAPDDTALFWRSALALVETEREDDDRWIVLSDAAGRRRIGLQRGEAEAGDAHLDVVCAMDEFDDETARLIGLGARVIVGPRTLHYGRIVNLADPDGHPFDLCAYR